MSRSRSTVGNGGQYVQISTSSGAFVAEARLLNVNYPLIGQSSSSTIVDVVNTPRDLRRFNAVTHTKTQGALMEGNGYMVFPHPNYQKPAMCIRNLNAVMYYNVPHLGLPAISWSTLVASLAEQLNGAINEGSMLGVSLLELGKTIAMVTNPFNLLRPNWRQTAGSSPASRLLKTGANIWLQKIYGWDAFFHDVKSFVKTTTRLEAISSTILRQDPRLTASVTDAASVTNPIYLIGNAAQWADGLKRPLSQSNNYGGLFRINGSQSQRTVRLGCRQNLILAKRMESFQRLSSAYGVSMSDLLPTIWELVPYSFVVDWFINWHAIGSMFQRSRLDRRDIYNLGCSVKTTTTSIVEVISLLASRMYLYPPWQGIYPDSFSGSPLFAGNQKCVTYSRSPTGSPSVESIIGDFLKVGLSTTRGISGAALAIQRILK